MNTNLQDTILKITDTAAERGDYTGEDGCYTAASAISPKKPISRRARPCSGVTATRQSATASGQPVRNGKLRNSAGNILIP